MLKRPSENLEVMCFIVPYGKARKIITQARKCNISGATVFLGKGTITQQKRWNQLFDLTEIKKEIVLMLVEKATAEKAIIPLNEKFKFDKPHHGIVFRMAVTQILGSHQYGPNQVYKGDELHMHNAIFVVVDRGLAEDVIKAAETAGSKGGTIINARGAGIHETSKIFNMEIEPEKEVVLILAEAKNTQKITDSIRHHLKIDEPGKGIIFVQEVLKTYGMH